MKERFSPTTHMRILRMVRMAVGVCTIPPIPNTRSGLPLPDCPISHVEEVEGRHAVQAQQRVDPQCVAEGAATVCRIPSSEKAADTCATLIELHAATMRSWKKSFLPNLLSGSRTPFVPLTEKKLI